MTFPPEGISMRASGFRSLRVKLFFAAVLVSPITSLAQSDSGSLRSNYVVSVQAETILQRGIELESGSAIGKYYLAWAQLGLNRLVEAERSAEQALVRNANLAEAYSLLARIHQRQRNAPAVARDLEVYLKLDTHKEFARRLADKIQQEMAQETAAPVIAAIHP